MVEIVCIRCNKIVHINREDLPKDFDQLNPGTTYKFKCCFCKNGVGKINDKCSFCEGKLKRNAKDHLIYCVSCGMLSEYGGRRCLSCFSINDSNEKYCAGCGKEMFPGDEKGSHYRKTPKDASFLGGPY